MISPTVDVRKCEDSRCTTRVYVDPFDGLIRNAADNAPHTCSHIPPGLLEAMGARNRVLRSFGGPGGDEEPT